MFPTFSSVIRKKVPSWNRRELNIEDFYALCDKEGVLVSEAQSAQKGEYLVVDRQAYIVLESGLKEDLKTWVALHELGHHFLHYPIPHRFNRSTVRKMDREANYFASVAMITTEKLKRISFGEETETGPKGLLRIRCAVFRQFGI